MNNYVYCFYLESVILILKFLELWKFYMPKNFSLIFKI